MRARRSAAGFRFAEFLAFFCLAGSAGAVTITVNSTLDAVSNSDGKCTLREAITAANSDTASGGTAGECAAGSGADAIHFAIPAGDPGCDASGVCTIKPTSDLPVILNPVTIDGYTQTGAAVNTLAHGTNAKLKIVINGSLDPVGFGTSGIYISANGVTIRGVVVNAFTYGITTAGAISNLKVVGCFVGTDAAGNAAVGNVNGLSVTQASSVTIGGTDPADRNLISANSNYGLIGNAMVDVTVQGNLVGTNAAGTAAIPNTVGAYLSFSGGAQLIGGTSAGAANVFSGNMAYGLGISFYVTVPMNATVQGNLVGVDANGTLPLGNGQSGIKVAGGGALIGGTGAGEANVIAFNGSDGILFDNNNLINGVTIRGNSIHDNGQVPSVFMGHLGISLGSAGPILNDTGDADTGPNGLQNYPLVNTVTASSVSGTLNSEANKTYTLDFYESPACGVSGYGEGKTYLGSKDVTTDGTGNIAWVFSTAVPAGHKVAATATNKADGSTSEFSRCSNLIPEFLEADFFPSGTSDGNGVFEPGETAQIRPNWNNPTDGEFPPLTSVASGLSGPGTSIYTITDSTADYMKIPPHYTGSCIVTNDCFQMFVSVPAARPVVHWDASFTETLSTREGAKVWKLHLGDSFTDVPRSQLFYKKIETVFHNAITVGCTATTYCPDDQVPRDQMAIFLARGIAHGGANVPVSGSVNGKPYNCVAGGVSLFSDVSPTAISCKSIHYIAAQNVTTGCQTGLYCPAQNVSRAQMAIFVAKGIVAPAGGAGVPLTYTDPDTHVSYSCDPASPNLLFSDVTTSDPFCKHVHFLYAKNVIAGCAGNMYCPNNGVTRGEMAKFLSNAFNLQLYGP